MRADVVIVGAGIGGGVLALSLARRGWRAVLVERESAPPRLARPEILWSATSTALEPLRIADTIRDASVSLEGILIATTSRTLVDLDADVFRDAGTSAFSTNPSKTRSLIVDAALATSLVEIHRGVAVDDLLLDGARVVGVRGRRDGNAFDLEAPLVVGDDGVYSVVRTKIGIELALATIPVDFVTAPIRWPAELPPKRARVWVRPKAFRDGIPAAVFIPWPDGEGVLLMPMPRERVERFFNEPPEGFLAQPRGADAARSNAARAARDPPLVRARAPPLRPCAPLRCPRRRHHWRRRASDDARRRTGSECVDLGCARPR
jgi:2-polyprenyl-6-methoxyphenol hydroxylase-like FAD-dependent oxidoreductase